MGFLWYFHPREWCNLIIIKPMPLLTPSPFCWSLLSPQVYTLTLSCLCACIRDPIGLIELLPRCSDLALRNGIGFWETAMDKHSKGKSRLGVCGTPWIPFSNAFDGISPDGRPLKSLSWGTGFIFLFIYLFLICFWMANSPFWCVVPAAARHVLSLNIIWIDQGSSFEASGSQQVITGCCLQRTKDSLFSFWAHSCRGTGLRGVPGDLLCLWPQQAGIFLKTLKSGAKTV